MIIGKRYLKNTLQTTPQKNIINRKFQIKYSGYFTITAVAVLLCMAVPTYFYLFQNYKLFINLAYKYDSSLVQTLERELYLFKFIFIGSVGLMAFFIFKSSMKMTHSILSSIADIEKQLQKLAAGNLQATHYDFDVNSDDYTEFKITYDYLYRTIRNRTIEELQMLDNLNIDPLDHNAYSNWLNLCTLKKNQLGLNTFNQQLYSDHKTKVTDSDNTNVIVLGTDATDPKHRAS